MSDTVLVAVVAALGLVIAALLTAIVPLLVSTRRHARAAREQVENNHTTNLRDEADERHGANTSRLATLERGQAQLAHAVGSIQDHLGIERTIPRPPIRRTK